MGEPLGFHHLLRFSHCVTPKGTYLIRSTTQLLHDTFNCHQTLHSGGATELRRARVVAMATVTQQISKGWKEIERAL
ncbi:hypothetical protein PBY51_006958 [Eleginops maclovinus]|uniref:Uncharacterized protein n=1 Tax=Eleginops maclovinus TaxID=56733 RepID=A0AAN7WXE0_ELEMC|nr:hypothetical protein PBY51_006958 [Eleginops maclovinus]